MEYIGFTSGSFATRILDEYFEGKRFRLAYSGDGMFGTYYAYDTKSDCIFRPYADKKEYAIERITEINKNVEKTPPDQLVWDPKSGIPFSEQHLCATGSSWSEMVQLLK